MTLYQIIPQSDYDKRLKFRDSEIACYSPKKLGQIYPDNEPEIVGELAARVRRKIVGKLRLDEDTTAKLAEYGTHSALLYRKAGYVCVGDEKYAVVLKHRLPFWFWFLLFGLGICLLILLIFLLLQGKPPVINPDNPLPEPDKNVQTLPSEGDRPDRNDGGGSVSMIYTLKAELSLESGIIGMHFKNPSTSTHDVVLELYVISGDQEIQISESGRIPFGNGLFEMQFAKDSAVLSEGQYSAKYKVNYYDPETGERVLIASDINDVVLTVTQ